MTKHFQETVSLSIVLSMFIHKISSKHGLDTTPSKLNFYTRHFCEDVGELYTIFTFRFSFWTLFDTQLMNFVRQFQTFNVRILKAYLQYTGPAEQFSKCGGQSTPFEVKFRDGGGGGGGGNFVDFKNDLPGADSLFFNTITTHQSFFRIL